jgi:sec-independent protein translocase protein TatA
LSNSAAGAPDTERRRFWPRKRCYPRLVPFGIGATEIVILLIVALLVFGPKRLPEMGRSLGRGLREFKDSISGEDKRPELAPPAETDERPESPRERDAVS